MAIISSLDIIRCSLSSLENLAGCLFRCGFTIDSAHSGVWHDDIRQSIRLLAILCDAPLVFPSSPSSSKLDLSLTRSLSSSNRDRRSLTWVLRSLHRTRLLIQIRVYSQGDKSNHWVGEKGYLRGTQWNEYVLPRSNSSVRRTFCPRTDKTPRILQIHLFRLGLRVWGPIHASNPNPIPIFNPFPQPTLRGRIEGRREQETGHLTTGWRVSLFYAYNVFQPESFH